MGFELYREDPSDPPIRKVSFDDLDNKAFWCNVGENKENAFVEIMTNRIQSAYTIKIHPAKVNNPFHPDLLVEFKGEEFVGEAKIKNSPLFYGKKYGVDPQHALTMDLKDSFNYDKLLKSGVDLMIFIWVKWEAHKMVTTYRGVEKVYRVEPMRGVWVTNFSLLREKEKSNTPPGIHWYNAKFRKPPEYDCESKGASTKEWCKELLQFEPRLKEGRTVKNITSKGFSLINGVTYPGGHSSASYVFDLLDRTLFFQIYYKKG